MGSVLERGVDPIIGHRIYMTREIPHNTENIAIMKLYCTNVRNFTNTAYRKTIQRFAYLKWGYLQHFTTFWAGLKLIQLIEPKLKKLCYHLLRNGWNLDYHLEYQDSLDSLSELIGFDEEVFAEELRGVFMFGTSELEEILMEIDPKLWIPVSIFPRFVYSKESKMVLAFEPLDLKQEKLDEFRELVKLYLRSLNLKDLWIPPIEVVLKSGSSRYNDGGNIKRDHQKPEVSFSSGFLYQKFNPKPLGTREVWLPDRATKFNNSFWMIIGRQLLKADPTYPNEDPRITWENIKDKILDTGLFDISGFGFQYPRQLLSIVADEIVKLYPNPDSFEYLNIFNIILDNVKVQMPDGSVQWPPRGIGLGYYEDLKTIGMNAILAKFDPISVYGDQGILPGNKLQDAVDSMRSFGFIIKPGKYDRHAPPIKWAGWMMKPSAAERPKQVFEPLVSLFRAEFHWERKAILRSIMNEDPAFYKKHDLLISFQYELLFGYEYTRGDSLWNFRNGGTSSLAPVNSGDLRTFACQRLITPRDQIIDHMIYETPYYTEWHRSEAKAFQIRRKKLYKSNIKGNTWIQEYASPIVELNKTRKPQLGILASSVSDLVETKLIVNYGISTGKLTFGLNSDQMRSALRLNSHYRNPFEAYATGGYSVETVWRAPPAIPEEWLFLMEKAATSFDSMYTHRSTRLDVYEHIASHHQEKEHLSQIKLRRMISDASNPEVPAKKQKPLYKLISMDQVMELELPKSEEVLSGHVLDIVSDMKDRQISVDPYQSDSDVHMDSDDDINFFLDDFQSEEEE
jgi:hypothetical protein